MVEISIKFILSEYSALYACNVVKKNIVQFNMKLCTTIMAIFETKDPLRQ
jgi:hypothetical protein